MASLELIDHTLDLRPWRMLPEQQHGAQQQPLKCRVARSTGKKEREPEILPDPR